MHAFARKAYETGILYIGGCCGFEAYHIRAIAEEVGASSDWCVGVFHKWVYRHKLDKFASHIIIGFLQIR